MSDVVTFHFDDAEHEYTDACTGVVLPHITGMLDRTGWMTDLWYTEDASERGTAVHRLAADYDLGALDVDACVSRYRGFLLAHVAAMRVIAHQWAQIEVPQVHPVYRFGGRPDRVGQALGLKTILEIKTGQPEKGHLVQTALQAILVAANDGGLPAEHYQRLALYLKPKGRFKLEQHRERRDLDEAQRVIRACCA